MSHPIDRTPKLTNQSMRVIICTSARAQPGHRMRNGNCQLQYCSRVDVQTLHVASDRQPNLFDLLALNLSLAFREHPSKLCPSGKNIGRNIPVHTQPDVKFRWCKFTLTVLRVL